MKRTNVKESASAGATGSGSVATVANPKTKTKKRKGVAPNALDGDNLMAGAVAKRKMKEGIADLAGSADADHEVQMARSDLYQLAEYSIKLHELLKNVSETQGLEGWVQAKITKSADYIESVFHHLEYKMKAEVPAPMPTKFEATKYKADLKNKLSERKNKK